MNGLVASCPLLCSLPGGENRQEMRGVGGGRWEWGVAVRGPSIDSPGSSLRHHQVWAPGRQCSPQGTSSKVPVASPPSPLWSWCVNVTLLLVPERCAVVPLPPARPSVNGPFIKLSSDYPVGECHLFPARTLADMVPKIFSSSEKRCLQARGSWPFGVPVFHWCLPAWFTRIMGGRDW